MNATGPSIDLDSPTLPEGLTWDEERKRAPQLLLKGTGSRRDSCHDFRKAMSPVAPMGG